MIEFNLLGSNNRSNKPNGDEEWNGENSKGHWIFLTKNWKLGQGKLGQFYLYH